MLWLGFVKNVFICLFIHTFTHAVYTFRCLFLILLTAVYVSDSGELWGYEDKEGTVFTSEE